MPYADTDFFVALTRPNDRLRESALKVYEAHKGRIYTSLTTMLELGLISTRLNTDPAELILNALAIAKIKDAEAARVTAAVKLIQNGVGIFDAFHASLCDGEIISSDHVYDLIGVSRIEI